MSPCNWLGGRALAGLGGPWRARAGLGGPGLGRFAKAVSDTVSGALSEFEQYYDVPDHLILRDLSFQFLYPRVQWHDRSVQTLVGAVLEFSGDAAGGPLDDRMEMLEDLCSAVSDISRDLTPELAPDLGLDGARDAVIDARCGRVVALMNAGAPRALVEAVRATRSGDSRIRDKPFFL